MKLRYITVIYLHLIIFSSISHSHKAQTHIRLSNTAVDYLIQNDSRFEKSADALKDILSFGAEHEDDWIKKNRGLGRFNFHFSPNLDATICLSTDCIDVVFIFSTCDSLEWGFGRDPCTTTTWLGSETLTNTFTWLDALDHADTQQGWVDLGYVIHLLEDLGVPAHVRNDPHPAKEVGPIPLGDPDYFETANSDTPIQTPADGLIPVTDGDPENLFQELKSYTQENFYSGDRVFHPNFPGPIATDEDSKYFCEVNCPGSGEAPEGRRIAYKGIRYYASCVDFQCDRQKATIDSQIAREQFAELAPLTVQYVASLIKHYFETATPPLPSFEPFDFALDHLVVRGNISPPCSSLLHSSTFSDSFSDELLYECPTSGIFFPQGVSATHEAGGLLNIRSADGFYTTERFGTTFKEDAGILTAPLYDGNGDAIIAGFFRADIPKAGQFYGIGIANTGSDLVESVELVVRTIDDDTFVQVNDHTGVVLASKKLDLSGVSEVRLQLEVNDDTNKVLPVVSLEYYFPLGGTEIFHAEDFDIFLQAGTIFTNAAEFQSFFHGGLRIEREPESGSLTGHVLDSNGMGMDGVRVEASGGPGGGSTSTEADGSYSLPLLAGTYNISITTGGRAFYQTRVSGVEVIGDTVQDFTLPPIHTLSGRITDSSGSGVEGVQIQANSSEQYPTLTAGAALTAADGTYSFPLYAATYDILLSFGETHYTAETGLNLIGDTARNYILETQGQLTGHVLDNNGMGMEGMRVEASGGPAVASTCTDADGSYSIPVQAGNYTVLITTSVGCHLPPDWPFYQTRVSGVEVIGDTVQDFTLPPIHTLSGRITDSSGSGVEGVQIQANSSEQYPTLTAGAALTAADGTYSFPLYAATYDILLSFGETHYTAETGLNLIGDTVRNYILFNP